MKELSIEEKAKAYDEAIKIGKELHKNGAYKLLMEEIFSQLKESYDERIRKDIVSFLRSKNGYMTPNEDWDFHNRWLPWLEKQGEKTVIDNGSNSVLVSDGDNTVTSKEVVSYPTTSTTVKPKFKVGDFIMNDYCMGRVVELTNDAYLLDTERGIPFSCEHNVHLWSIQDAKDGDIIYIKRHEDNSEWLLIFKEIKSQNTFIDVYDYYAYSITTNNVYHDYNGLWGLLLDDEVVCPATKEQCNLLFAKMKEEGYKWDAEEKDLKKISQEYPLTPDKCIKSIAWSEEDEEMFNFILKELDLYCDSNKIRKIIDWLKSIKERIK